MSIEPVSRNILLNGKIDSDGVKKAIESILAINEEDSSQEKLYRDWEREPIKLFINSGGGSVYDGLALIDTIELSKTPVYTIALGQVQSMGFWIFLSGTKRYVGNNTTLMWHDISAGIEEKVNGIEGALSQLKRLQKMSIKYTVQRTYITEKQLEDYISKKSEWYMTSEEAISLGVADGIYIKE